MLGMVILALGRGRREDPESHFGLGKRRVPGQCGYTAKHARYQGSEEMAKQLRVFGPE